MSTATDEQAAQRVRRSGVSRRIVWLLAALLLQVGLVGVAVAPQLSARVAGDEYRLLVGPVDPIDPFRGAYVDLGYPGLPLPSQVSIDPDVSPQTPHGRVYVPLVRDDSVPGGGWKGASIVGERPASGPSLQCENQGWRLRCGIESWFVPQDRALQIEQAMRGKGAVAVVRIDSGGRAAIVDLQPLTAG